jgi:hypothetical protein
VCRKVLLNVRQAFGNVRQVHFRRDNDLRPLRQVGTETGKFMKNRLEVGPG